MFQLLKFNSSLQCKWNGVLSLLSTCSRQWYIYANMKPILLYNQRHVYVLDLMVSHLHLSLTHHPPDSWKGVSVSASIFVFIFFCLWSPVELPQLLFGSLCSPRHWLKGTVTLHRGKHHREFVHFHAHSAYHCLTSSITVALRPSL